MVEPTHSDSHVADLVAIDALQDHGASRIADALELSNHFRCHIEPPRFEHERHDGKPGKQVAGCSRGRLPQPVVSREIAVTSSEIGQPHSQKVEVDRLFRGHCDPIVEE
jgi:hypothetical protein